MFDKNNVYTCLNIDDVKEESYGYFADNIISLKNQFYESAPTYMYIEKDEYEMFVDENNDHWPYFYKVGDTLNKYTPFENRMQVSAALDKPGIYLTSKGSADGIYKILGFELRKNGDKIEDAILLRDGRRFSFADIFNVFEIYDLSTGERTPCGKLGNS